MANENIKQVMQDAILDADSLERFINGSDTEAVLTRLSAEYPTLQNAIKQIFGRGGLPATPFKTKAEMEASSLASGSYAIVTNEGKDSGLYIKEPDLWVRSDYDPILRAENYTDEALSDIKGISGVLSRSYNLFNPFTLTHGYAIPPDGNVVENPDYAISDYIEVEPDTTYLIYSSHLMAFTYTALYDKDKNFVSRVGIRNDGEPNNTAYMTTPSNVYYVRHSINEAYTPSDVVDKMFAKGSEPLPFVSGVWTLDGVVLGESVVSDKFAKQEPSENLFDTSRAIIGKVIPASGELADNEFYATTDYIPVSQGDKFVLSGYTLLPNIPFTYVGFYDADKKFISRAGISNTTFDTTHDGRLFRVWSVDVDRTAYVRFSINLIGGELGSRKRMISKGEELTEYSAGIPTVLAKLPDNVVESLIEDNNIRQGVSYLEPVKDWYSADSSLFAGFEDWKERSSAQVHQMWEDLQAQYPHALEKEVIGNDAVGNPMYLYTVKPDTPEPTEYAPPTKKIFLTCSIHGIEKVPSLAAYLMLREMLKRDAPKELQAIRANCTLLIVPIANPSGWDLYKRKNANGVDLNRNFEVGFMEEVSDPSSESWSGETPLSEPEAVAIDQVFQDNPDIDAFYDFHNFFDMDNNFVWIPTSSPDATLSVAQPYISRITRQWRAEFDWIPDEPAHVGKAQQYPDWGMTNAHAKKYGIKYTATFEVCESWKVNSNITSFGEIHCKTAVEAIANWLLINLDFLSREG